MSSKLRVGHFRNFKSEPQMILFSGDKEAVYKLEKVFRNLSKGKLQSVRIDQLDFVIQFNNLQINALSVPRDIGLIRQNETNSFTWSLCSETWGNFAQLISILRAETKGHHYLDCFSTDNTHIMISLGEYSDDFVGWNEDLLRNSSGKMVRSYPYPPDINWVKQYSRLPDAEFLPPEHQKARIGIYDPKTGQQQFEYITLLRVLSIGGLYLVESSDDPDDWAMGDMVNGCIDCWGFYGGLKNAIDGL